MERRPDEARLVADGKQRHVRRDEGPRLLERGLRAVDDGYGVRAGLTPDFERHVRRAIQPRERALLLRPVRHRPDVGEADGRAVHVRDDEILESARVREASERPERDLAAARVHVAPGHVGILALEGGPDLCDRDAVGREAVDVDPDVDRALEAAHDRDLADARRAFDERFDDLVGDLRQLAHRALGCRERDRHHGRVVVVELLDEGRIDVARELAQRGRDAVAHVLRGHVDVALEAHRHHDDRGSRPRDRAQLLDALDRVDRFFERDRDLRFHFLGGGPRERCADDDRGQVDRGEPVDAEPRVGGGADDDERQHDHRSEDRAPDADLGELLHGSLSGSRARRRLRRRSTRAFRSRGSPACRRRDRPRRVPTRSRRAHRRGDP